MGINPKHKGYCTPMSKHTCTQRRKALAKRLKPGGDLYKGKTMKKKEQGGALKQLNDMQYARKGKAVGSILEGGKIKYNEGGPFESFAIKDIDVQKPLFGSKITPKTTSELVDDIDLHNVNRNHKNARYVKSAIKKRINDGNLLKNSPEHKAIKNIFKKDKKAGKYKKKNFRYYKG